MPRFFFHAAAWALVLPLLISCGGGAEPESLSIAETSDKRMRAAVPAAALDPTLLFDWAERTYPQHFPGHRSNQTDATYVYRHYPELGNYIGVAGGDLFILGPSLSGGKVERVGALEGFRCRAAPGDCAAPGYARAGWVATLSKLAHGVSGTVTIVDSRTLRLSNFQYDGGGPQVYAYLGREDSSAAYQAGLPIGPRLNRGGVPYLNATLDLQLPEGQTLDSYVALSIWCSDFRANFGSGVFKAPVN